VILHVVENLQYNLHQMILSGDQLLEVDGVVVGGGGGDGLNEHGYKILRTPTICNKGYMEYATILFILLRMKSWTRCRSNP
jgi:hypothetical protein